MLLHSDGQFAQVGEGFFKKELLRVGKWRHPVTGGDVKVTRERLERIVESTRKYHAAGHKTAFPDGHTVSAKANMGHWGTPFIEGDRLYATVKVEDEDALRKVGKTIQDVSVYLEPLVVPETGEQLVDVLTHVCATPVPVVGGQENFIKLSRDGGVVELRPFERVQQEESMDALKEALGLSRDAGDADVVALAVQMRDKVETLEASAKHANEQVEKLSRELAAAQKAVEAAEQAEKTRVETAALSFVDEVKTKSAEAGSPVAKDDLDEIKAIWVGGNEALARKLGKLHLGAAAATDTESLSRPAPQEEKEAEKNKSDLAEALSRAFEAQGLNAKLTVKNGSLVIEREG